MFEFSISGNRWFDRLPQPVLLARGKTIKYCNPAAEKLLPGLKKGKALLTGLPEECAAAELLLEGQRWAVSAFPTEEGTVYLFRGVEEIPPLNSARMGMLSGQLRLLLGRISFSAEALEDALAETEQLRNSQRIARLNRGCYQLRRVVDNLDFYSQEADSLRLLYPPSPLNLTEACRELERTTEALAELIGRNIVCQLPKECLLAYVSPVLLRRLLLNLMTNAFQAKGDIILRLEKRNRTALLTLTDTGKGIDRNRLAAVFAPEEREEELPAPGDGCGLGLPICRKIARLFGGQLLLSSDEEGTRVSLSLPLCREEDQFRLFGGAMEFPGDETDQVLTELSPVLPADCFRMEAL